MTQPNDVFVEIKAVARARDAVRFAIMMPSPARIISPPGLGKSTALRNLAKEFDGAYLEIGATDKDVVGMYRAILQATGGTQWGSSVREILHSVQDHLKRRARYSLNGKDLLIVDEFQALEDTAKRELLRLHEIEGFALVLSGNPERLENSRRKPTGAIRQVEDRIGMNIELPALDDDDCDLIARAYGVNDPDALDAARTLGAKANARDLGRTMRFAQLLAQNQPVRLSHIKNAFVSLKGKTDVLNQLKS